MQPKRSLPAMKQRLKRKVVPWARVNSGSLGWIEPSAAWHSAHDFKRSCDGVFAESPMASSAKPDSTALPWLNPGP